LTSPKPPKLGAADVYFDVPVDPDRDTARKWAVDELSKREYQPGTGSNFLQRFLDWIANLIDSIGGDIGGAWGGWGAVAIAVVVAAVLALIIWLIVGPLRRSRSRGKVEDDLGDPDVTAKELDSAAASAARAGDWNVAVIGAYRALIRSLAERDAIDPKPGMTALEASLAAADAIPSIASSIAIDADVFDGVKYGHLAAQASHYQHILATRDTASRARIEVPA